MPRIARIVAEGYPHHVTQRGNRKQEVFFCEKDYQTYLTLLGAHSKLFNLEVESYCLMPNHVHMILVPRYKDDLSHVVGMTHQKYTNIINKREGWRGYLWQGRFSSFVLDDVYLLAATRYILLNPVKAGLVDRPWDYKWSSARHHLGIEKDTIVAGSLLADMVDDWKEFINADIKYEEKRLITLHEKTGRPLGNNSFVEKLENILGMKLKKSKPGPKPKHGAIK